MSAVATIKGVEKVVAALRNKAAAMRGEESPTVTVGYTASYAIYVHERVDLKFKVGQAKFLEEPARNLASTLAQIVKDALKRGVTMSKALLLAGLRLQRESQKLCPVDTGNLRASAYTRLES